MAGRNTAPDPPAELSHAGAVVDKAIEYLISQKIGELAIASALLGGALEMLARTMDEGGIVQVLQSAIDSVRAGELHDDDDDDDDDGPEH